MQFEKNYSYYQRMIDEKKAKLERANACNEQHKRLQARYTQLDAELSRATELNLALKKILLLAHKEDLNYKEGRKHLLESIIDSSLVNIFPNEELRAKLSCDFKRNSSQITLRLEDKHGKLRKPSVSEGQMMQYLISVSAMFGVLNNLGCTSVYLDEAFSVSSPDNLVKVGAELNKYIQDGMQIFCISQNSEIYDSIPHRAFYMHKDPIDECVIIDKVVDI